MSKLLLAALATSLMMISGTLAQDGARAYFLLPENTNIASVTVAILHSEIAGSQFDAAVVTPSYRRTINVGGNAGAVLIGLPIGRLSAGLNTGVGTLNLSTSPALGDVFIGGELGLLNSPSLAPMDYAQHKPGLRAAVAAKLFIPTGDYDPNRLLNLGANRWSLQASVPISYSLGSSMVDPELTTFEFVPSVQIFGDNNDPFGPPTVSSQEPIWGLEGHATRTLSPNLWAAVDGYYEFGGRTFANGVQVGQETNSFSVGATLGLVLSRSVAVRTQVILNKSIQMYQTRWTVASKSPRPSVSKSMQTRVALM